MNYCRIFCPILAVALILVIRIDVAHPSLATAPQSIPLTTAAAVTLELSQEHDQTLEITADAQRYVLVSLHKGDLNLSLTIHDPAGRSVFESRSQRYEPVDAAFISGMAGVYRLTIHSLEQEAINRQFNVELRALRPTAPDDFIDVSAFEDVAAASRLRAEWTSSALRAAIEKYKEASSKWRSQRNWLKTARSLAEAAEIFFTLGQYHDSLGHYLQALTAAQEARDAELESIYLSRAASLHSILGNPDQEKAFAEQSLIHYARKDSASLPEGTKHSYGVVLGHLGEVYFSTGDLIKAVDYLERSEKLLDEVGDRGGAARTRLFLGYTVATQGDRLGALTLFYRALTSFREVNDRSGEAQALTGVGIGCSLRRNDETALTFHRQAREIFRTIGDRQSEAITMNGIAQAYQNLHQYDLAIKHYDEALKQFQANGSVDFVITGLCVMGGVYKDSGDTKRALSYFQQCEHASRTANRARILAYAMDDIAAIYAKEGRRAEALAQYNHLLKFYNEIGDRRGEALTLSNLGDLYLAVEDPTKALDFFNRAVAASKQAGESGVEISTLYSLAKAEQKAGMIEAGLAHIKESIAIIEELRSNLASPTFRSTYFSGQRPHYDLYIALLMRLDHEQPGKGYAATALLASENARARSLREMLAEMGTDIRQGLDPATLKRERELQQLLSAEGQNQSAARSKEAATDFDVIRAEYEELLAKIRQHNPHYESLLQPAPLSIEQIQTLLDDDTILLEYALAADQSYVWAVTKNSLTAYPLPDKETIERAALEHHKLITARQPEEGVIGLEYQRRVEEADKLLPEKSQKLSNTLLGPVAHLLKYKRVLIVAEGALQYTPFDALPLPATTENTGVDPEQRLVKHEIVSLPSFSTLAAIRSDRRPRNTSSNLVAVFADPVFTATDNRVKPNTGLDHQIVSAEYSPQIDPADSFIRQRGGVFNRLANTADEAEAIRKIARSGVWVAKGFEATRDSATGEELGKYRIIHFATHGVIDAERPELSAVVLSMLQPDGTAQNGFLQLHEIYRLRLTADLTVLSACNTALGKDVKGEGLIGLTRAFMYAGSRSVVASLWEVDDRATAFLMENFYTALLRDGLTPAAALRSAKEAVRNKPAWRHPYFWAGFVLQGEYNEPIAAQSHISRVVVAITVIILAGVSVFLLLWWRKRSRIAR